MLARFQVESGIRARLLSPAALAVPPRISQELLRLIEAALSNVRRHSGATSVDVVIERDGDGWRLGGDRGRDRDVATTQHRHERRNSGLA